MPKLRYLIRLLAAFFSRYIGLVIISFIAGLMLILFAYFFLPQIFNRKSESIGYVGRYSIDTIPKDIASSITIGLVRLSDDGEVLPGIAESWETLDNGKTWTFKLEKDLFWHDGTRLTAKDINFSFTDVKYEIVDNDTLKFSLDKPYIPFPVLLSGALYKKGLIGVGDWVVKKTYFRSDFLESLVLDKDGSSLHIKFYPTEEEAKLAYKMGQIRKIIGLSDAKEFENYKNTKIIENTLYDRVVTLFINMNDPQLADKNYRLALNYALDKQIFSERAYSPINPNSKYFNPQVKTYDYDLDRAKERLEEAQVNFPDNYELKLVSTPSLLNLAEKVSESWTQLGIKTSVLVTSVVPEDYQVFLTTLEIPPDPDQYSLWHSTQEGSNITNYKNLRIDKILEDGRVETDPVKRQKLYLDFQRFLIEDSPAIFLTYPKSYDILRYGSE